MIKLLVLDAACADYKETLINYLYNSQFSRAISILLIPWTLPIDLSLNFTKKIIDYVPTIDIPKNDSKNMLRRLLICYNFLVQKFKYDKYQYHSR